MPNGTDAKEIALHFLNLTNQDVTRRGTVGRFILNAKRILDMGYTKQEIIDVIDFTISVKHLDIYSLGFYYQSMDRYLRDIKEHLDALQAQQDAIKAKAEYEEEINKPQQEVTDDDESKRRNQEKARRNTNVQSRFREKFNFDMFEGQ